MSALESRDTWVVIKKLQAMPLFYLISDWRMTMEDNTRKFMQYVSNVVNESKDKAVKEIFGDGYNEAAGICVGMITKKMDELYSQISSGSFLSEQEQFLLSNLKELKSETEEKLYDFWRDNGNE